MPAYNIETSFEMMDGRILSCEYVLSVAPGRYWGAWEDSEPDEVESGEPTYFIDGVEVSAAQMPKGLTVIADKLYDAAEGEYNYVESEIKRPGYEPDDY